MGEIEVVLFKKKKSCQIILAFCLEDVDDFIYLFTYLLKHLGIKSRNLLQLYEYGMATQLFNFGL
jgi:hypothetical protein